MNTELFRSRTGRRFVRLPLALALWLGGSGGFLNPGPLLQAAEPPDFSAGVQRFLQLGLPDVKDAKYVKIEWRSGGGNFGRQFGMPGKSPTLTGNAWLLEDLGEGKARVLVDNLEIVEIVSPEVANAQRKKQMEQAQQAALAGAGPIIFQAALRSGEWKEVDIKADLNLLLEFLETPADENDFAFQYGGGTGRWLLFTFHAHQHGERAAANQAIDRLIKRAGDSRRALSQAMNQLADSQYQQAYRDFEKAGDWQNYLAEMDALLARYPGVWRQGPVVERVAGAVRKHLELKTPPPVRGEGLTEADQQLAAALAASDQQLPPGFEYQAGNLWVLGSPAHLARTGGEATAVQRILERKFDAMPLLIALLEDDYLIRAKHSGSRSVTYSSREDDPLEEHEIEQHYQNLARPISRGELARKLLEPLVTEQQERYNFQSRPGTDEIRRRAQAWHEQHRHKTESELLRHFLTEGAAQEQQAAFNQLINSKEEGDRRLVEEHLLKPDKLLENIHHAARYAQTHRAQARPFITQYLEHVKALPSLVPDNQFRGTDARYQKMMEDNVRKQLRALEELISDQSAEDYLKQLVAAEEKFDFERWGQLDGVLWGKLAEEPAERTVTLLLTATLEAKDDMLASMLLQSVSQVRYRSGQGLTRPRGGPLPPVEIKLDKDAELWKRLLNDQRPMNQLMAFFGPAMGGTMGQMTAMAIEGLYQTDPMAQMRDYAGLLSLGDRLHDIYKRRAEARLAGTPESDLPPFPDKANVSAARREEIRAQLQKLMPEDSHEISDRLTANELLVIGDLLTADQELNARLNAGSHVIRKTGSDIANETLKKACDSFIGKPLNRALIESLVEECKKVIAGGDSFMVTLSRSLPLRGVEVTVGEVKAGRANPFARMGFGGELENQGMLMVQLMSMTGDMMQPIHGMAQWTVPLPEAKKSATKTATDDDALPANVQEEVMAGMYDEMHKAFWSALEKLLAPEFNASQPYSLTLSGIQPSETEE